MTPAKRTIRGWWRDGAWVEISLKTYSWIMFIMGAFVGFILGKV